MKNKFKKIVATVAAIAVALTTVVVTDVATAQAAENDYTVLYSSPDDGEIGRAGQETKTPFTISESTGDTTFYITVVAPTGMTLTLYDSAGNAVDDSVYISSTNQNWRQLSNGLYQNGEYWTDLKAGNYSYGLKFDVDNAYYLDIVQYPPEATISQTKATVTAGFTYKLSVTGSKVKSWASNKKAVATVDKNGKVTGKKKGSAKITATLTDGKKLTCQVTVKANKYSAKKITTADVYANAYGTMPYSASFDKNGNLSVKVMIVNNGMGRMTKIPNFKVTVKNQNGKTVGTYSTKSFNVNIPSYSAKSYTVTVKKSSKLSAKKVDLVNSKITSKGGKATVYY